MALTWTEKQRKIYAFLKAGKSQKEIVAEGFKRQTIRDVQRALTRSESPETSPKAPKTVGPEEPLFEVSTKGVRETLDPIILMRYDALRNVFSWSKQEYPLSQFIDEASDLVCQLAGAVPPGFVKVEEKEEVSSGRT